MKLRGLQSDLFCFSNWSRKALTLAALLFLLAPLSTYAFSHSTDEVRDLIKKAAKLARDNSYEEAEALLRQAVKLDPGRNEAKVELAYVLVKERRPIDAYDLVLPVIERDRSNSRGYA